MEYYKLLNLTREPFSNTPDPGLFFRSTGHAKCLQELEIAIRLGRGLCVIAGEVGTGKTTICRHLIRSVAEDDGLEIHMILDPSFESGLEMLAALNAMFNGHEQAERCVTATAHKEMIKDYLFGKGVREQKRLILVVDEGQKLSSGGVEILRELLNYETNDRKLLQIIIFGQNEMDQILARHPNFADRVALFHRLLPLSRRETALFIKYRLERSEGDDPQKPRVGFTRRALSLVHSLTGGYPRKIVNLCHNILLSLIIGGQFKVTPGIVRRASHHLPALKPAARFNRLSWALGAAVLVCVGLVLFWTGWRGSTGPAVLIARPTPPLAVGQPAREAAPPSKAFGVEAQAAISPPEEAREAPEPAPPDNGQNRENAAQKPLETAAAQVSAPLPETSVALKTDEKAPAASLGGLRVQNDETLWSMVETIYGTCNPSLIQRIVRHNPSIQNPNRILRGQMIHFPAIKAEAAPGLQPYWILLERFSSFEKAYAAARNMRNRVPLRILGVQQQGSEIGYLLVVKRPFERETTAQGELEKLRPGLPAEARLVRLDRQTVIGGF
jgi:general secretion pathway protein A